MNKDQDQNVEQIMALLQDFMKNRGKEKGQIRKGGSKPSKRRSFTIKEKLSIIEKVLAGEISVHEVRGKDGKLIHYGVVQEWILAYQAGRFKNADKESKYLKTNLEKKATSNQLDYLIAELAKRLPQTKEKSPRKGKGKKRGRA